MSVGPSNQLISSFGAGPHMTQFTGKHDMLNRNGGAMESVAELGKNADGSMNMKSRMEAMKPYFGVSQRQVEEDPYAWWETENYDLPDAYKGKNPYILNIIITAILTSDMWPVTEMLPYKKNENGMKISWDQWIFSDSMLDRTPEEATSRMTTNTQTSYAQYLVRRGKAFILEHGFWKTPMGQKNWAMNIVQIVNATTETACFGATHAVLTAPAYIDPNERFSNRRQRGMVDVDSMMMEQTDSFARVQKEEGGLATVLRKMDETFRNRNGHEANYVVLPSGCEIAIQSRPENNYAIYNGRGPITPSISAGYGWTTRVSRGYRIGEHSPNCDPHFSTVCIGGFHVLTNQAANLVPIAEYRTQHRTILIFSMSKDDFTPMELSHVFGYLGLYENWHEGGKSQQLLSQIGRQFFHGKYRSWGNLLDSAGEKHRAVSKIQQLSDEDYEYFNAKFNQGGIAAPKAELQNDWRMNQPSTSAMVDQITNAKLPRLDAVIHDLIGVSGARYINFAENGCITCDGSLSQYASSNDVAVLYDVASRRFLHYNIVYSGRPVDPAWFSFESKFECVTTTEKQDCARVVLSIVASLLFGMITYYSKIDSTNDALNAAGTQICTNLHNWLVATVDPSGLLGSSGAKLANLLINPVLLTTHYTTMSQFSEQAKLNFPRLINFIVLVVSSPNDAKLLVAFKELVAYYLNDPVTQVARSGWSLDSNQNDTFTNNALVLEPGSSDSSKATRELMVQFMTSIKATSESKYLELGSIRNTSAADKIEANKFLEGFRARFTTFAYRLSQLWLGFRASGGTLPTDSWYVRVMTIVAKFKDSHTASRFLSDLIVAQINGAATQAAITGKIYDRFIVKIQVNPNDILDIDTKDAINLYIAALNTEKTAVKSLHVIQAVAKLSVYMGLSEDRKTDIVNAEGYNKVLGDEQLTQYLVDNNAQLGQVTKKTVNTERSFGLAIEKLAADGTSFPDISKDGIEAMYDLIALNIMGEPDQATPNACLAYFRAKAYGSGSPPKNDGDFGFNLNVAMVDMMRALMSRRLMNTRLTGCRSQDAAVFEQAFNQVYARFVAYIKNGPVVYYFNSVDESPESVLKALQSNPWWSASIPGSINEVSTPVQPKRLSGTQLSELLDSIPLTTSDWARYSLDHDIPFPIGAIGFRLHKQFDMGSAIMMDARGQTGYTYFGHADFQLGDDIGKKIHVAHFTVYLKSVVMHPKLIVYAKYIISRGYFGGEGTQIYDPLDSDDREDFHSGRVNKDILYAPVLSNFRAVNNVMDVTGKFPPGLSANSDANRSIQYESAEIMRRVWHLNHGKSTSIESGCAQPLHQTLAMQEHTQTWNNQRKGFTDVTLDKGHWGKNKYPGCGAVLKGDGRYLERTIHDQTKTMTIGV